MRNDHDPVDSALESLRSATWTGNSFNPQLEEKLMQEFMKNPSPRRFSRLPTWFIAVAGVLIAGGAATGTVALVRGWFVTVQIGDREYQLQTDENGRAEMVVQTDDGKTANIQIQRTDGEAGDETHVQVNVDDANQQTEKVVQMVRRTSAGAEPAESYTAADLGGTQPAATWNLPSGATKAIHFVPQGDSGAVRIFTVTTNADGSRSIRRLAELPARLNLAGQTPEVTHDANGTVTLTFAAGEGQKRVLKFREQESTDDGATLGEGPVQVDPAKATIRINTNPPGDDE
jgi:hypothetical protein